MSINLSPKLLEIIKEVSEAKNFLQESRPVLTPNDVRLLRANLNIIEKGEKRIQKEFTKRTEEMSNIQKEIEMINEFSTSMGYTLTDAETETTSEPDAATETETTSEPDAVPPNEPEKPSEPDAVPVNAPESEIKIKVGKGKDDDTNN